jgi:tetratricopeptide (TPR) repeat protein
MEEALRLIEESLRIDKFNFGCLYEKYLITNSDEDLNTLRNMMRGEASNYDEISLDYCAAGCYKEAFAFWKIANSENAITPMTYYYLGWCMQNGNIGGAIESLAL